MKKSPVSPDLPAAAETTRCKSANRPRKLIIKCGGRLIGCTTDKDAITAANTTGGDDPRTELQQSPLEPTVNPKRRKKNDGEPERDQSHTPRIAPSLPPTLHDLDETTEKLIMHGFKTEPPEPTVTPKRRKKNNAEPERDYSHTPWIASSPPPEPTPPPVVTAAITGGSPNGLKINESICDDTGVNIWEGRTRRKSCLQKERPPFRFALTESEIEEDFMKMTMDATRPPRRQKKRPKDLQKKLDDLVPGLRLVEVKASLYKV